MSKYHGKVGYVETIEDPEGSGIWVDQIVERNYYGDILMNISRWNASGEVNDNLAYSNQISIVADPYAYQHFSSIKYIWLHGAKWKVSSITENRPRLVITLGGVYTDEESD